MQRRASVVALTALVVFHAGPALAASIAPNPKKISAATAAVSSCGNVSGIGVSWTSTANVVSTVVLTAIPAGCTGATLSLTLVGAASASLATIGPVTVTGTSQTFTAITGSANATSVTGANLSMVGP